MSSLYGLLYMFHYLQQVKLDPKISILVLYLYCGKDASIGASFESST